MLIEDLPTNNVSSVNWEWLTLLVPLTIWIPSKFPKVLLNSNLWLRESAIVMSKRGDRGHLRCKPFLLLKNVVGWPLIRDDIHGEPVHTAIHYMKVEIKLNLFRKLKRNECLRWSKEFSISNLTTMPLSLFDILECVASCTSTMLSIICLLCIKLPWFE
jgi:hypothetical protein